MFKSLSAGICLVSGLYSSTFLCRARPAAAAILLFGNLNALSAEKRSGRLVILFFWLITDFRDEVRLVGKEQAA